MCKLLFEKGFYSSNWATNRLIWVSLTNDEYLEKKNLTKPSTKKRFSTSMKVIIEAFSFVPKRNQVQAYA